MMEYSFIVPVYNCRPYLEECVACICSLGLDNAEVLLIDDGSTDGSGALCDALGRRMDAVRVIHQENRGASAARNRGIREATGRKILFVDADDSFDVSALGKILRDPICDRTDMVLFGLTFDYYFRGRRYRRDRLACPVQGILPSEAWGREFAELFSQNALSPLWNKVFHRSILLEHRLQLNEQLFLYEDLEFVLRYMQHCENIGGIPDAVYHYRQAEDEGNAGRRLARIPKVSELVTILEKAAEGVRHANPAVSTEDTDAVLQMLFMTLANGKIGVSKLPEIREVCRDYQRWSQGRALPLKESDFESDLRNARVLRLYLKRKKSALRHWLAVRVKALHHAIISN